MDALNRKFEPEGYKIFNLLIIILQICFGDVSSQEQQFEVHFTCNMSVQILIGNFNPSSDTLDVRGSFNGWSGPLNLLSSMPQNPDLYRTVVFDSMVPVIDTAAYKYVITNSSGTIWENVLIDPWYGNRWFIATGTEPDINNNGIADIVLDTVYFSDERPQPPPPPINVIFEVNMRPAYVFLTVFDSITFGGQTVCSIDSVFIAGEIPLVTPRLVWVWDYLDSLDLIKPLKLNDDGTNGDLIAGDSVWTITLAFHPGAPSTPIYKYSINGFDNEAPPGVNHIENVNNPPYYRHFDEFGEQDTLYSAIWNYSDISHEIKSIPTKFEIFQNYPNPFNPSTRITYRLSQAGFVRLEIFNIFGQEIRTLVNDRRAAGLHTIIWDGLDNDGESNSSGIYFCRFQTQDFVKIIKMILIR